MVSKLFASPRDFNELSFIRLKFFAIVFRVFPLTRRHWREVGHGSLAKVYRIIVRLIVESELG